MEIPQNFYGRKEIIANNEGGANAHQRAVNAFSRILGQMETQVAHSFKSQNVSRFSVEIALDQLLIDHPELRQAIQEVIEYKIE